MIADIGIALIALIFVIVAGCTVQTLRAARSSLEQMNQALSRMEHDLREVSRETINMMQQTQRLTATVQQKINATDALFQSLQQIGDAALEVSSSFSQASAAVSRSLSRNVQQAVHKHRDTIAEWTEWTLLAADSWRKWKSRRNSKGNSHDVNQYKGEVKDDRIEQ